MPPSSMDTFEHALITRSTSGASLTGFGVHTFAGQARQQARDIVDYLEQIREKGWALVAVEPAADETRYWLRRAALQ